MKTLLTALSMTLLLFAAQARAVVTVYCCDEAAEDEYIAALGTLVPSVRTIKESFEAGQWEQARFLNSLPSVTNLGITWSRPGANLSTSSADHHGPGSYQMFTFDTGTFMHAVPDGYALTADESLALHGVGGWFSGNGAKLAFIVDDDPDRVDFTGNDATVFGWTFMGFIDTTAFGSVEIKQTDEGGGETRIFFSDDFSIAALGAPPRSNAVMVPDINLNGTADIAAVCDCSVDMEIRDGDSGELLSKYAFFDTGVTPISVAALPDSDADGISELAVLGTRNSDGRIVVGVRNVSGPDSTRLHWFAAGYTPIEMKTIGADADENGVPELVVLSTRNADGKGLIQVRNAFGETNSTTIKSPNGFTPAGIEIIEYSDGTTAPEVATLLVRDSDARTLVQVRNLYGTTFRRNIWFTRGNVPIDLAALQDKEPDGIPEVALLSSRESDGRNVVEVRNVSGAPSPSKVWLTSGYRTLQIADIGDSDGNGFPEVAVLSVRQSDGRMLVEVRNTSDVANTRRIWYASGFAATSLSVFDDIDGNGVVEAAVLGTRASDGKILVQGRNVFGDAATKNYWFSL